MSTPDHGHAGNGGGRLRHVESSGHGHHHGGDVGAHDHMALGRVGDDTGELPGYDVSESAHDRHGGHDTAVVHGGHGGSGHGTGHAGHGGHDHVAMFRRLFWIMLAFAVPTVLLSEMFASIVGYTLPDVPGLTWVAPMLGTVMYVWGGRPFLTGAVGEIRARKPGMMLLIGMAITVAFVASWGASVGVLSHELDFWWELALLIVIMLLGHWLEMRSLAQTASALDSLAALLPDEAEKVDGDRIMTVAPPSWSSEMWSSSARAGGCRRTARSPRAPPTWTSP
jgi:P-type Cu2+ transporter